jgi:hypothetical protein
VRCALVMRGPWLTSCGEMDITASDGSTRSAPSNGSPAVTSFGTATHRRPAAVPQQQRVILMEAVVAMVVLGGAMLATLHTVAREDALSRLFAESLSDRARRS